MRNRWRVLVFDLLAPAAAIAALVMSNIPYAITLGLIAVIVIWLHRENIRRLIAGTEPRVGGGKA